MIDSKEPLSRTGFGNKQDASTLWGLFAVRMALPPEPGQAPSTRMKGPLYRLKAVTRSILVADCVSHLAVG
jgi:hypothetical protein